MNDRSQCNLCGWVNPWTIDSPMHRPITVFHIGERHPIEYFQECERTLIDLLRAARDEEVMIWYIALTKEMI